MPKSQWHRIYGSAVAAPPPEVFDLLSDLPNYGRWLPRSSQYEATTDVVPYPVRLGSRHHDGKPNHPGKDWWGTVTGFQPPGCVDFRHTIDVRPLRTTIEVHIHYSFEPDGDGTQVTRWLVLDISMPVIARPLRPFIIRRFDQENRRTLAAVSRTRSPIVRSAPDSRRSP
jgi:uncharacterized protein YndB with AHSA1/START domain